MSVVSYSVPVAHEGLIDAQPHRSVSQVSSKDPQLSVQLLPSEREGETKEGDFSLSSSAKNISQPKTSSQSQSQKSHSSTVVAGQTQSVTSTQQRSQATVSSCQPQLVSYSQHSKSSHQPTVYSQQSGVPIENIISQPIRQSASIIESQAPGSGLSQPVSQKTVQSIVSQPSHNTRFSHPQLHESVPSQVILQPVESNASHVMFSTPSNLQHVQEIQSVGQSNDGSHVQSQPIQIIPSHDRSSRSEVIQQPSTQYGNQTVQNMPSGQYSSRSGVVYEPSVHQSSGSHVVRQSLVSHHSQGIVSGRQSQSNRTSSRLTNSQVVGNSDGVSTFGNVALQSNGSVVAVPPLQNRSMASVSGSVRGAPEVSVQQSVGESLPTHISQQGIVPVGSIQIRNSLPLNEPRAMAVPSHSNSNSLAVSIPSSQSVNWDQPMQLVPIPVTGNIGVRTVVNNNSNIPQLVGGESNPSAPSSVASVQLIPRQDHWETLESVNSEIIGSMVTSDSDESIDLGEGSIAYRGLKEVFTRIDKQNKGVLTRAALIKSLRTDSDVRKIMHLPSKIGQGSNSQKNFERIFQAMDSDDDREITWEEFRNAFFGCQLSMFRPKNKPSRIPQSPVSRKTMQSSPPPPPPTSGPFSHQSYASDAVKTYSHSVNQTPPTATTTNHRVSYNNITSRVTDSSRMHQSQQMLQPAPSPSRVSNSRGAASELQSPRKSLVAMTYPAHPVDTPASQQDMIQRARTKIVSTIPIVTGMSGEDESELLKELALSKDLGDTAQNDLLYGDAMVSKGMEADALLAYQNSFKLLLQALDVHTKLRSHATLKNNRRISNTSLIEMTRLLGLSNAAKDKIQDTMTRLARKQDVADVEVVNCQREALPFSPEPPDVNKDFHISVGDDKRLSPLRPIDSVLPNNPFEKKLSPRRSYREGDALVLPPTPLPMESAVAYNKQEPLLSQPLQLSDPRRIIRNQSSGDVVSVSPSPGQFQIVQTPAMMQGGISGNVPQQNPVSVIPPCPRCGGAASELANFCQICGAALFRR